MVSSPCRLPVNQARAGGGGSPENSREEQRAAIGYTDGYLHPLGYGTWIRVLRAEGRVGWTYGGVLLSLLLGWSTSRPLWTLHTAAPTHFYLGP